MAALEARLHREAVKAIIQLEQLLPTPDGQPLLAGAQHGHSSEQYIKLLIRALARHLGKLKRCEDDLLIKAAEPIGALLAALYKAFDGYILQVLGTATGRAHAEQVEPMLREYGLYAAIAAAATRMTAVLQQQQQPANLELQSQVAILAGSMLWTYRSIVPCVAAAELPMRYSPFQATLNPASSLAVSILQAAAASATASQPCQATTPAAAATTIQTKKGGKSRGAKPAAEAQGVPEVRVGDGPVIGAVAAAGILAAVLEQASADAYGFCAELERSAQAKLLLQSQNTLKLLAAAVAVAAAVHHERQRGVSPVPVPGTCSSSSSSKTPKQQQQVLAPAYHQQLLTVLGLQHVDVQLLDPLIHKRWTSDVQGALNMYCMEAAASMADINSSGVASAIWHTPTNPRKSAADTDPRSSRTARPGFAVARPLMLPLLLTVLELQVLEGGALRRMYPTVQLLNHLLHMVAVKADFGTFLAPDTAAVVLEALLLGLGPVVLHALSEKAPIELQDCALGTMWFYGCLLTRPLIQADFCTTAQLFFKQPLVNAVAIDSSLRAVACRMLPPALKPLAADTPVMAADAVTAAANMQPHSYRVVCVLYDGLQGKVAAAASSRASGEQLTAKAAAAALAAGQKHLSSALLSLLMTCCKTGSAAAADAIAGKVGPIGHSRLLCVVDQAAMTAEVAMDLSKLYAEQQSGAGSSSRGQSQDSSIGHVRYTDSVPWLVLAARCLLLISHCYQQDCIDPAIPPGMSQSAVEYIFQALIGLSEITGFQGCDTWKLGCIASILDWSGQQLTELLEQTAAAAPGGAAAAGQDHVTSLLQQQASAVNAVRELQAGMSRAIKAGMKVAVAEQLRVQWGSCWQLVERFSTAICSQLPISSCCNNTSCSSVDKLSEQQLVGGKGCVCAGCGVARYCSRECQQQHWKEHKPVCKRLKASVAAGLGVRG